MICLKKVQVTAELKLVAPRNLRQVANQIHRTLNGSGGGSGGSGHPTSTNFSANSPASRGFGQLRQQMLAAAQASQKTTKAVNTARHGFDSLGKSALIAAKRFTIFSTAAGSIYAVAHALKNGVSEGIAWQDGMVRIAQITGKSTKQLRGLSDTMHGLASGLGVSSRSLQESANVLSQAGLSATDTRKAMLALAKTDLAPTFDDLKSTTEGAIAIFGQFGTSVDKLEGQLGSINAVSAKYAVESSDLVTAIRVSGGAFRQAGGNLNELLALFTSVRGKTRESASSIANAFKTIFARLQRKGTQTSLKSLLGIDLSANGISDKPLEMIRKLHMAMKDLPEGSLLAAKVGEQVGGIRQLSKTIPLIKEYGTAVEALRVAQAGENSLSRDTITAQESLEVQLMKTREAWKTFYDNLVGDSGFQSAIKSMLALARGAATLADSLRPLIPALTAFASIKLGTMAIGSLAGRFGLGKHAAGGLISGGTPGQDSVPSLLMPGEFVMQRSAVQKLGVANLQRMNRMKRGGLVGQPHDDDVYGFAPQRNSSPIQTLISVIKDEIMVTRQDIAERKATKSGTYGFAQARPANPILHKLPAIPLGGTLEDEVMDIMGSPTYGLSSRGRHRLGRRTRKNFADNPDAFLATTIAESGYRSLTREQRLENIAKDKRSDLLARFSARMPAKPDVYRLQGEPLIATASPAQSRLAMLANLGYGGLSATRRIGGKFIGAVGSRLAPLGRFAKTNFRGVGIGLGALALSGQGEALGERLGGARGKAVTTSVIGSAALGATVGSVGGVPGAIVGGLVGGLHGVISGLNQFEKELASKAIEDGFSNIEKAASGLASALEASHGQITADVLRKAGGLSASEFSTRNAIELGKADRSQTSLHGKLGDTGSGYGEIFSGLSGLSMFGGRGYSATVDERRARQRQAADAEANDRALQNYSANGSAREAFKTAYIASKTKNVGDFGESTEGRNYIHAETSRRAAQEKQGILHTRPLELGESQQIHEKYRAEVEQEVKSLEAATVAGTDL